MDKWINPANAYASYGPDKGLQTIITRVNNAYEAQRMRYMGKYIQGASDGRQWPGEDEVIAKVDKKRKSVYN